MTYIQNDTKGSGQVRHRKRRSRHKRRHRRYSLLLLLIVIAGYLYASRQFVFSAQAVDHEPLTPLLPSTPVAQETPEPPGDRSDPPKMPELPLEDLPAVPESPPVIPDEDPTTPEHPIDGEWNLLLINQDHILPEDFEVPELTQLRNRQAIDSRAYPELQRMFDDARAVGHQPLICSSFRTWDKQAELFERKVRYYQDQGFSREESEKQASVWVARPGTSEHQAGLAVDIVSEEYQILDEKQADTPLQQWLMEHCWEYGFILRYPTGKSDMTGVGFEPWHYRYVGYEAARTITEQGICLEEYLGQL